MKLPSRMAREWATSSGRRPPLLRLRPGHALAEKRAAAATEDALDVAHSRARRHSKRAAPPR